MRRFNKPIGEGEARRLEGGYGNPTQHNTNGGRAHTHRKTDTSGGGGKENKEKKKTNF